MKTASMVLGIVGGALRLIGAFILVLIANVMLPALTATSHIQNTEAFSLIRTIYDFIAIPIGLGGILGLIGGLVVKKNNTAGGVLMIIGTVLGLDILLLLGGIFAFIQEKQPEPPYAAYPNGQYLQNQPYPSAQPDTAPQDKEQQ